MGAGIIALVGNSCRALEVETCILTAWIKASEAIYFDPPIAEAILSASHVAFEAEATGFATPHPLSELLSHCR
jgi:hypothetical protein